ncbi:MAG: DUF3540 domain-containing protein [Alteromonadaceae bacterium]|nr:DUF3540 domain-containing protein [Alteromonadaceae bacterium]
MGINVEHHSTFTETFQICMHQSEIIEVRGEEYVLNNNVVALRATGCLIEPQMGDQVLYWQQQQQAFITMVLQQKDKQAPGIRKLSVPNHQGLVINAKNMVFNVAQKLQMNVLQEINFNAAVGKINHYAQSMLQSVQGSLIQLSNQYLNKSEHIDFEAKKLLKSHGEQQLITASKDLKMDADRINMG